MHIPINSDSQNSNQVEQNLIKQLVESETKVKTKGNFWIISTIVFALLLLVTIIIFAVNYSKINSDQSYFQSYLPEETNLEITTAPTIANRQTTILPTTAPTSNLELKDFANKELLGENENYSVYLIVQKQIEHIPQRTGEIIVYDKKTEVITTIDGSFDIFGGVTVTDNGNGEYILLSAGTYSSRQISVISLKNRKQIVEFCSSGNLLFWNNFVIYDNCDTFQNRPWGVGEAPSVTASNLVDGQTKILFKSELTYHYKVNKIENNTLYYDEVTVEKEVDWNSEELHKTVTKTYNLLSL